MVERPNSSAVRMQFPMGSLDRSPYFVTWLYEKSVLSWQWSVLRTEGNRGIRQKRIVHVYSHMEAGNEGGRMESVDSIGSSNVRFSDLMGLLCVRRCSIFSNLQLEFTRKFKIWSWTVDGFHTSIFTFLFTGQPNVVWHKMVLNFVKTTLCTGRTGNLDLHFPDWENREY